MARDRLPGFDVQYRGRVFQDGEELPLTTRYRGGVVFDGEKFRRLFGRDADAAAPAEPAPYVPTKPAVLRRWRAIWRLVKDKSEQGWSPVAMATAAGVSPDTVAKIIKAGEAGLL